MLNTIERPETVTESATVATPAPVATMTDEQITAMAAQLKAARAARKQQAIDAKAAEQQRIDSILAEIGPKAESIGYKLVKTRKPRTSQS